MPAVQSYPDPVAGAPRSFVHRVSELSSLEGDTVRQEKLKKMRKSRKPPSWQSASSQSPRSRIKTLETVPTTAEQSKTSMAPCSFQWLALIACLSTLILFTCLTWLIFTFWDSWPGLLFFFFNLQHKEFSCSDSMRFLEYDMPMMNVFFLKDIIFCSYFFICPSNGLQ